MTCCTMVSVALEHEDDLLRLVITGTGKDTRLAVRELMELPPSKELELPPTAGKPARKLMRKLGLQVDSPVPQVSTEY